MQLKIQRSQRDGGVISKNVIFCLDARVQLTAEEQANISRYKLGGQVIYNSQSARKHLDSANAAGAQGSYLKSLASIALAAVNLNITIDGLQRGQHVECKDLDELLSAEEALMEACQRLRSFLDAASTFDGRETLIDFSQSQPTLAVQPGTPVQLAAPPSAPMTSAPAVSLHGNPLSVPVATSQSYSYATSPDPLALLLRWWESLIPTQRTWIMVAGALLGLVLLLKLL